VKTAPRAPGGACPALEVSAQHAGCAGLRSSSSSSSAACMPALQSALSCQQALFDTSAASEAVRAHLTSPLVTQVLTGPVHTHTQCLTLSRVCLMLAVLVASTTLREQTLATLQTPLSPSLSPALPT
jgi:hypothetical protein